MGLEKIKEYASNSYPSVGINDELVSNLSQIARLVNEYQKAIWDKVHAMPTAPIKIKPETKKVKE